VKQQPLGTVIVARLVTLPYSSTAAGVNIDLLPCCDSPETVIAVAIGVTVPPVGTDILPVNSISYLANEAQGLLTIPRRIKIPEPA
jgi:hypothetical protein